MVHKRHSELLKKIKLRLKFKIWIHTTQIRHCYSHTFNCYPLWIFFMDHESLRHFFPTNCLHWCRCFQKDNDSRRLGFVLAEGTDLCDKLLSPARELCQTAPSPSPWSWPSGPRDTRTGPLWSNARLCLEPCCKLGQNVCNYQKGKKERESYFDWISHWLKLSHFRITQTYLSGGGIQEHLTVVYANAIVASILVMTETKSQLLFWLQNVINNHH